MMLYTNNEIYSHIGGQPNDNHKITIALWFVSVLINLIWFMSHFLSLSLPLFIYLSPIHPSSIDLSIGMATVLPSCINYDSRKCGPLSTGRCSRMEQNQMIIECTAMWKKINVTDTRYTRVVSHFCIKLRFKRKYWLFSLATVVHERGNVDSIRRIVGNVSATCST